MISALLPACIILFLLVFPSSVFAADVVINEFSPNASPEWVEFYNASDSADYIKSYYLDDDTIFIESDETGSSKKLLANLVVTNLTYPYFELSSFLNNSGDFVVIFDGQGNIIDQYQYTSDPGSGITIGRSPDNTGSYFILASATKGSLNAQVPTMTPTQTPTNTPTPTNTLVPTPTPSATSAPTATSMPIATSTPIATPTRTVTVTPTTEISDEIISTDVSLVPAILGVEDASVSGASVTRLASKRPLIIAMLFVSAGLALFAIANLITKINI